MAPTTPLLPLLLLAAAAGLAAGESDWYHREHVRIHFFNKDNADLRKGFQILRNLTTENILASNYNPDVPTKVLIHGFNNGVLSESMQVPKNAYLASGDLNVIVIDWSDLNPMPLYLAGFANVPGVAARVAEFLDFMVDQGLLKLDSLHIVGHSLGAHVAGVTAEKMASGRVPRITGLDPARPGINMLRKDGRLSDDDADLVDVVHSNAGTLGEQAAIGHIDFYANGGKSQPGCRFDFLGSCSHGRAYYLWSESIANPQAFSGWLCEDEWDALHKRCERSQVVATMGEKLVFSQNGSYYFETNAASPFSKA